ncbi:tripartite motif-containing protein 14 isoform X1 [Electrophorus electricus]|uniref:tripartite motif-containing protein 14 isoform X1 n=1 Tax=Electrophorus electricus TaxID=8005 RepID=UPI0015CFE336|nr:tripartite motif-containing protein 14 isoform X1 [Electrophorus electricus]
MAAEDCTAQREGGSDGLDLVTEPYPRSPKPNRKTDSSSLQCSQEQLSCRLAELEKESRRTEAHVASLKKRQANLTMNADEMVRQVRERYEGLRLALDWDEQAVLERLEQEHRESSSRLTRVLQDWSQHLRVVRKHSGTITKLQEGAAMGQQQEVLIEDFSCHKKLNADDEAIRLNEERFQKLLKALGKLSKDLEAQLQRKILLLDSTEVVIDSITSHRQIKVTSGGRSMYVSPKECSAPHHPLQFDQVYCALGSAAITAGQHYWEASVHCCPAWAVGVAYSSLHRKGRDKSAKLGRNRLSWCLEFQDGHLSAWHNDRHVALSTRAGQGAPNKVGVFVNYPKGYVAFYDAEAMKVLQEFSGACSAMFERAHHQFTEPLFPAFRFFKPKDVRSVPDHMRICELSL